jgi:uncharacterized membrane protein
VALVVLDRQSEADTARTADRLSARTGQGRYLRSWVVPTLLALPAFVLYARHSFTRYSTFRSAGYDLGIFDQAARHYAHLHAPIDSVKGPGFNLLGDHFSPILALLAPAYWAWPDPRMLGVVLAALAAISVFPIYRFTNRRLGMPSAALISVGYLLWWPMQNLINFDFHEVAVALPVVAWLIDALDQGKNRRVLVLGLILLGIREDMGVVLMMVALILAIRRDYRWSAAFAVIGATAYILITSVLVPALAPTGTWAYWDYPALGPNAGAAARYVTQHPLATAHLFVSNTVKRRTVELLLFGPSVFSVASPYALLALPILAERMLSARATLWDTGYHYDSVLGPILVLAAVDTIAKIARAPWLSRLPVAASLALPLMTVIGTIVDPRLYPLHSEFTGQDGRTSVHTAQQAAAVATIPSGVCVEADDRLIPHLVGRDTVTTPTHSGGLATWLALDMSQDNSGGGQSPAPAAAYSKARTAGFVPVFAAGPLVVLHKNGPVAQSCAHIN